MPATAEVLEGGQFNGKRVFLLTIALAPPIAGFVVGVAIVIWSVAATVLGYNPSETPHAPALLGLVMTLWIPLAAGFAYVYGGLQALIGAALIVAIGKRKNGVSYMETALCAAIPNAPLLILFNVSFAAGAVFFFAYFLSSVIAGLCLRKMFENAFGGERFCPQTPPVSESA